jgi:hypothetical protein
VPLVTPPTSTVLVLSPQPLVAALLGMLLDLLGYRAVFAAPEEQPEDALGRDNLLVAVLVDGDVALSDAFFARAAQRRLGVALFGVHGRPPGHARLARLAADRGIPSFELPLDLQELSHAVERAAASDWWRRRPERRAAPREESDEQERLVFVDPVGRRWSVYDRRSGVDRRGAGDGEVQRVFVNDEGEEWAFQLEGSRAVDERPVDTLRVPSPAELQRQLDLAVRVERGD